MLIVDGDVMADVYPYLKGFRRTLINPELLEESDEQCEYEEGCLSVPGIYCNVRRPSSIKVRYYDEELKEHTEVFDKFACRMIQHEMSHLDGVLFVDRLAPEELEKVRGELEALEREGTKRNFRR